MRLQTYYPFSVGANVLSRISFVAGLLFLLTGPSYGTLSLLSNLNFLGFSKDGQYLAFEEWSDGGDAQPYSQIFFIDVANNRFAVNSVSSIPKKSSKEEDETVEKLRADAKQKAEAQLRALGIEIGNIGEHLVNKPGWTNDYESYQQFSHESPKVDFGPYQLEASTISLSSNRCDERQVAGLQLLLSDRRNGKAELLQRDRVVPKSRGCPHSYRVQDIFRYRNHLAIFLNVIDINGGITVHYMVVTAQSNETRS